jgi:hypothetical protein
MRVPLTSSLFTLALLGAASVPTYAATLSDDDLAINFACDIQAREEFANARAQDGNPYDIVNARDGRSDQMDTSARRARLWIYGTYDKDWKYLIGYLVDKADNTGYNNGNRAAMLYKAWLERNVDMGAMGLTSTFHAGVDYPFYNIAIQGDPNWLFCNQRATGTLGNIRGVGLRYKLYNDNFVWGFDIMKDMDGAKPGNTAVVDPGGAYQRDGLFYSSRLEYYPIGEKRPAYKETYAGDKGQSLMLAADVGFDDHDLGYYNTATDFYHTNSLGWGLEAIYHLDELTVLAEGRWLQTKADAVTPGAANLPTNVSRILLVQAGYCIPVDGMGIEPALRFTSIDYRTGNDPVQAADNYDATGGALGTGSSNSVFGVSGGDQESGLSGHQIDAGVNLYFKKHIIETQIDYSYWHAAIGTAKANIVRVQEQLAF